MKKRTFFLILAWILCCALLCACGSKTPDPTPQGEGENAPQESGSAGKTEQPEKHNEPEGEVSTVPPLDMEGDEYSLVQLLDLLGQPESVVRETLAMEDGESEKSMILFGENVDLNISIADGKCTSLQLIFWETALASLQNAVSEQLGQDATEDDDALIWQYENTFDVLYQAGEGCILDLVRK